MVRHTVLLIFLLLVEHSDQSPTGRIRKSGKSSIGNKNSKPKQAPSPVYTLGQLFYENNRLELPYNLTEKESQVYAANYTMFPDGVYYPWLRQSDLSRNKEEFQVRCLNITMKENNQWLNRFRSEDDTYMSVAIYVLKFICIENYGKDPNRADLFVGGLWMTTLGVMISLVMLG
ncbi:Prion doppel [Pelobates cultripes]|uniref:Prion doppel n=1 Tax=Pelobates cultripes TaxID=61616 RepID=A0AAD1RP33_PELCU|nr:Prion doppel [Pelobates cultripes]